MHKEDRERERERMMGQGGYKGCGGGREVTGIIGCRSGCATF